MTTIEIKEKLIAEIKQVEDEQLLKDLYAILKADSEEEVYQLSEEQVAAIEEAREQYRNGEYFTHEEVMQDFEKWIEE